MTITPSLFDAYLIGLRCDRCEMSHLIGVVRNNSNNELAIVVAHCQAGEQHRVPSKRHNGLGAIIEPLRRFNSLGPSFVGSENSDPFHSGNSEPSGNSRKG